jgi:peptidoglycan-N-acetylglucosamine deacetylase
MLTFRRFTFIFFIVLLLFNLARIFLCHGNCILREYMGEFYILWTAIYLGVSVALAFFPCSGFHHPVRCSGHTSAKEIALTFDDGPSPQTSSLLDVLESKNATATFFVTGKSLEQHNEVAKQIHSKGHIIGNHTWSHSYWFDFYAPGKMYSEMTRTASLIESVTSRKPLFFRPPYGVINPMLSKALGRTPYTVVCWSIRSFDTTTPDPLVVQKRILGKLKPGAIIVLHDHTVFTQQNLCELIDRIYSKGFSIVPLDKLLQTTAYA